MRALGLTLALPLAATAITACSTDFDPTYEISCPSPVQVGTAAAINLSYTSVDPIAIDWRAEPATAGAYTEVTTPADPTNEGEPVTVGTQFNPATPGTAKLGAYVQGVEVASCAVDILDANVPPVTVTVVVMGMGTVTAATPSISCPGTCSGQVLPGTQVQLTPSPATDWDLSTVTGGCTASGTQYEVTPQADTTCVFTFVDTSTPPTNQVQIPAGPFTRGCIDPAVCPGFESSATVVLSRGFSIDKYEVTVAEYRRCVDNGACTVTTELPEPGPFPCNYVTPGHDQHPMNCVSWTQARAYCQWLGMDLPTEAQWERAARGAADSRTFPWGEDPPTCELANVILVPFFVCNRTGTSSVAQHPTGASPDGCEDMIGNVEELVLDWYAADYYRQATSLVDPTGPATGSDRIARGGSFRGFRTVHDRSFQIGENAPTPTVGFRCVTNP